MRFYNSMKHSALRVLILLAVTFLPTFLTAGPAEEHRKYLFYVGTYTEEGSKSKGIYAYRFDADTGQITSLGLAAKTTNPSFVHSIEEAAVGVQRYEGCVSGFRGQA